MSAPEEHQNMSSTNTDSMNTTPTNTTNDAGSQTGASAPGTCSCPTSPAPGSDPTIAAHDAPLLSANIDAGLSGILAGADVLGQDLADVSIGLGLVDTVLDLADSKVGLVDSLLCDIV
jgi:hypothetical protein